MSYCRICKLEYGTEPNLKFHRIPRNETMRNKWMEIIGKVVPASAFICSKHFSEDQYKLNQLGEKKRLKPDALPKFNSTSTTNSLPEATSNPSDLLRNVSEPFKRKIAEEPSTINLKQRQTEQNTNLECQQTTAQGRQQKLPKPRFLEDLREAHFVRKEDFQIIERCLKQQRLTADRQKKRVKRWKKQVVGVKSLLSNLKNEGLLSSEATDKIRRNATPHFEAIVKRAVANKEGQCSQEIREFASTLMFYSASAYDYVRKVMPFLPHPQSVRRWFKNTDFAAGIFEPVLPPLQKKIETNKEENKTGFKFGLMDEIHLEKGMDTDESKVINM